MPQNLQRTEHLLELENLPTRMTQNNIVYGLWPVVCYSQILNIEKVTQELLQEHKTDCFSELHYGFNGVQSAASYSSSS